MDTLKGIPGWIEQFRERLGNFFHVIQPLLRRQKFPRGNSELKHLVQQSETLKPEQYCTNHGEVEVRLKRGCLNYETRVYVLKLLKFLTVDLSVVLVALSWGWDVLNCNTIDNGRRFGAPEGSNQNARIHKIIRSLWLFDQKG